MWIIITLTIGIGIGYILRIAIKKANKYQKTISKIKEEMYMENDIDEFSPEASISDETIKRVLVRYKLNQIEKEQKDIDLDYHREDGK